MEKKFDLREERLKIGFTQEKLAELLEVTPEYISMLENGRKPVSPKMLKKFNKIKNLILNKNAITSPEPSASPANGKCAECSKKDAIIESKDAAIESLVGHIEFLTFLFKQHTGIDALYTKPPGTEKEFDKYKIPPEMAAEVQQQLSAKKRPAAKSGEPSKSSPPLPSAKPPTASNSRVASHAAHSS